MAKTPWRRKTVPLEVDAGVVHTEAGTVPTAPIPGEGTYWVRSDSPNVPMFTDDAGTDFVLNSSGGGSSAGLPGNIYENLQFYVDPADRNSFPAEGGTVATDLEGNGTAGTLSAAAVFDNGAWTFDGASGDDVRFTKGATLDNIFAGGGTIITILRPYSSGQGTLGRAIDTTESTSTTGYYLSAHDELSQAVRIRFNRNWTTTPGTWTTDNITDAFGTSNRPLRVGDWAVVAVSYDDTTTPPVIYLNGTVLAVTETSTPSVDGGSDAGNDIYVGNRSDGTFTWNGQIGTTLMFDRILTADEVQQVTNAFYARRGIGIRGYDSPPGTGNAQGQTILIRAGDAIQSGTGSDGGDIILQAGNLDSPGDGQAGRIVIRSGDMNAGTTGTQQSNILIESGDHLSGGGNVTLRVGTPSTASSAGALLLHAGDTTGTPGATLIRGGGRGSAGISGAIVARGGDGSDYVGGAGNRAGGPATFRGGDGAGFSAAGGLATFRGGDASGNSSGGDAILRSGTSPDFNGGDVEITASDAGSFGVGGNITVTAGDTTSNQVGGGISFTTGSSPGNFTDFHAGDFEITTGNATGGATQPNSGAGSFYFTGGTSNATVTTSPGGEFEVTGGAGTANSVNSRGGAVSLTGGAVTGASAATAGGVTLTGGAATTGTGGTVSLQPGTGTVADGSLILKYSTYPPVEGAASTVLTTDGAGTLSWAAGGGSAVAGREGILYNGNTFYMDAGDRSSYDGSGSTVTDLINSTEGTLNGVQIVDGHFNFNVATDDINFGTVVASETENIFGATGSVGGTLSVWVRPESDGFGAGGIIATTADDLTTEGWTLRVDSQSGTVVDLTFGRGAATSPGVWMSTGALEVGQWNHIVIVYSDAVLSNDPTIYVNTLSVTLDVDTNPTGAVGSDAGNDLFIGGNTGGTEAWEGDLDVVIFYDRQLSAEEVGQLYRVQQDRFRPSLIGVDASVATSDAVDVEIKAGDGGATAGDGGGLSINLGNALAGVGDGGGILYSGGDGSTTGNGGGVLAAFGDGGASGAGGSATWIMGDGGATTGVGGSWNVTTGDAVASGQGGGGYNITLGASVDTTGVSFVATAGTTNAGIGGSFLFTAPEGTTGGGFYRFTAGNATSSGNGGVFEVIPGSGIDDDGYLEIDPAWTGDGSHYIQLSASGANTANATQIFTGDRDPNTLVSGLPGSLYIRGDSTDSTLYVNKTSGTAAGTDWSQVGVGISAWQEVNTQTTGTGAGSETFTLATPLAVVPVDSQNFVHVRIIGEDTTVPGTHTFFTQELRTYYRAAGALTLWSNELVGTEQNRGFGAEITSVDLTISGNAVIVELTMASSTRTIDWCIQFLTKDSVGAASSGTASTTGQVLTFDNRGAPISTGSIAGAGSADFETNVSASYGEMKFLRVSATAGASTDVNIIGYRDSARTVAGEIYRSDTKDPTTQFTDRVPATLVGNDGTALESNTVYWTIENDAGTAVTLDFELVFWSDGTVATASGALDFSGTKVGAYTAIVGEHVKYDATAGPFTLDFPASASPNAQVAFKNVTTDGTTVITYDGNGNDIEDPGSPGSVGATAAVAVAGVSVIYQFDGTQWWII